VRHSLSGIDAEADARRERVARLFQPLALRATGCYIELDAGMRAGWLRFPLRLRPGGAWWERAQRAGVERSYPRGLPALEQVRSSIARPSTYPGAEELAQRLVTAPTHRLSTARDLRAVAEWVALAVRS
jgi:dTDP-4-amino-4,6-dideoxygalactose transaminase